MSASKKTNRCVYIGVDVGGTNMRAALVDSSGRILESRKVSTLFDHGVGAAAEALAEQIMGLACVAQKRKLALEAVGLGVAGKIDKKTGTVLFSPNIRALDNYPLGAELQTKTGFPVFMENDANAFGFGESFAGAAKGVASWVGITLGTGTGGCVMLGGSLWEGDDLGFCGEIGHMIVQPDGPDCPCGSKGCLEAFASARALVGAAKREVESGMREGTLFDLWREGSLSADSIYDAAKSGDRQSISLFETFGWALGIAISNLFTVLGIRHAVIGGGVSASWDLFIGPLMASLSKSISMLDPKLAVVSRGLLGDDAGLIGAARVAQIEADRASR